MRPNDPSQKPSMDGMRPAPKPKAAPEYRYDHELPAPKPEQLLESSSAPDLASIDKPKTLQKRASWKKRILIIFSIIIGLIVALIAGLYVWYQQQLSPVSSDTKYVRVTIASGTTPSGIAKQLKEAGVIRSQAAFAFYTKLTRTQDVLKAGAYNLQPSSSTPDIVKHLVEGKQDTFRITFLPGDTLQNNRKKFLELDYSEQEVDAALNKTYSGRLLFTDKPATADLEGYIYGETYEFDASATVETILNRTFDEYEAVIKANDLINGFKKQGFTLYEGITLASIVQREVPTAGDQAQIARVFLNRLAAGMTLGSDVTYQYIADKTGVERTPNLDSPYNTRKYPGLPPGPIATAGVSALKAVANPATNDYLFFLSGDDDVTYFAKTDAGHQQNIVQHCKKKCLIN